MEQREGGNFNFPPDKRLQSDIDTSAAAVAAAAASSAGVPAAKKLARQLDFTASGARGGGGGGVTSTTSSMLQSQQMRVPLPAPCSQSEMMTTVAAMPQMPLRSPVQLAQSYHPTTIRPIKPESPKSRPRPNADVKDGTPKRPKQCNCKHSKCLKLYCECFASGIYCDGCNCVNCYNNIENEAARREAVEVTLERNPDAFRPKIASSPHGMKDSKEAGELLILAKHNKGCHCKKSGCLKKYCECFQANILCSDNCKCADCKNFEGSEERRALFHGEHNNNLVYIQQAANAAITGAIGSSGYGSLPFSKKRKAHESLFGTTTKDAHRLAQLQQANHNMGPGQNSIHSARNDNVSALGHSKFTYRSLLADIIEPRDLTELCSVLVVVSQEAAKTLEAQKREEKTETILALSIPNKADNRKETDTARSVTEGCTSSNQEIQSGPDDSSDEADLPISRPMSPATLALMCDEQDTMFMVASSPSRAMGQDCSMPSLSANGQAMTDVYAEQERIVLTKFRDCLTRLINVGEIKEIQCSSLAKREQGNQREAVNNGVTKPTAKEPNMTTSTVGANLNNQHSRSLPPPSENTAVKPKVEIDD